MRIFQDSREQAPYAFAASRYAEAVVEVGALRTGDYSLYGLTDRIALERKFLSAVAGHFKNGIINPGRQLLDTEVLPQPVGPKT